jgi:hypothetical protein
MRMKSKEKIELVTKSLTESIKLGLDQVGNAVAVIEGDGNPNTYHVNTRSFRKIVINEGQASDITVSSREIKAIQEGVADAAEATEIDLDVYIRVATVKNGVELDVGDKGQTRIRLAEGKVELINKGSEILFYRPASMLPFVVPAEEGNLDLLFKYLNFDEDHAWLLIIWVCLTLSTPRSNHANYPILVLIAEQGASKSTTCKLIIRSLLDPSQLGIQGFPSNRQDIVIAANNAHVLIYDNLRYLSLKWSDTLCIASTGGNDPVRRLYCDNELVNHPFQVPLVLNGIHDFVEEPDLAQRCLRLELKSIPEAKRRDEKEFTDEFNAELPEIFRGILDLTANIMEKLPTVKVTHPERMLGYVKYLAAAEEVLEMEPGKLQAVYSQILNEAQRDSVLEDPLASMVYEMVTDGSEHEWKGTPTELLIHITGSISDYNPRQKLLPNNAISLSKRLNALKAPLRSQNIEVIFTRGKERRITITNLEAL